MNILLMTAAVTRLIASQEPCTPIRRQDASVLLHRAAEVTGLTGVTNQVLKVGAFDVTSHLFESDRMYPPALAQVSHLDTWFDPTSGVERTDARSTLGGYEFAQVTLGSATASYAVRDTTLAPSAATHAALYATRPLNVWAMMHDWLGASDVMVDGQCVYRDYPRIVLRRIGARGVERLYLDPKSGYPVKLDRTEPHYLWGQTHVEFVYSTWQRVGAAHLPGGSFRLEDGATAITRTFGDRRLVVRDSAPSLSIPQRTSPMEMAIAPFLAPTKPDTIRVGATTFLLRNRGYTETVALVRDTVYMFDATQGEERTRQDSLWIANLFPGRHPLVVVVTDLAWPHVAGVRSWVARGATIVAHRAARDFLASVIDRRWTSSPDLLERRRKSVTFKFHAVSDSLRLAGGDVLLYPIDGAASEVALNAFVRPEHFLWASDFVQDLSSPSQYVDEVVAAARRVGVVPSKVASEHAPLVDWTRVMALSGATTYQP